ncbi:hypothetical protein CSKR_110333, partial [Clonorchis sinensis]
MPLTAMPPACVKLDLFLIRLVGRFLRHAGTFTMRDSLIRRPVIKSSPVASFWRLAAMQPEGNTRARILPGFPSLDRGSREAEVAFEQGPYPCAALLMKRWLCAETYTSITAIQQNSPYCGVIHTFHDIKRY